METSNVQALSNTANGLRHVALHTLPEMPLVSVVMTNYNYAQFLEMAVSSLRRQTYANWEAVICDDGSTDDSPAILKRLAADEPRLRLIFQPNGGQCAAVNRATSAATGDIVCFLDADDEFDSNKLERIVSAYQNNPIAGVCTHYLRAIDREGKVIVEQTPACLDSGWLADRAMGCGCSVMVPVTSGMSLRAEICQILFPMPPSLKRDADGYLFMAAQFLTPFCVVEETLGNYRVHGSNMGGLIDLAGPRLRHEISLIRARSNTLSEFLVQRFGSAFPSVDISLNPHLIQTVLKLRALGIDSDTEEFGSTGMLVSRHPNRTWRLIWTFIFMLPRWLRTRALPVASRSYNVKGLLMRFLVRPQRMPNAAVAG